MLWLAAGLAIGLYFGYPPSQEPSTGSTARMSPAEPQSTVDGYDAGLATRWANAIEEPRARQDSVGSAFNRWLESDPAKAHAWLAKAEMSDEFRTALARAAEAQARGRNE